MIPLDTGQNDIRTALKWEYRQLGESFRGGVGCNLRQRIAFVVTACWQGFVATPNSACPPWKPAEAYLDARLASWILGCSTLHRNQFQVLYITSYE